MKSAEIGPQEIHLLKHVAPYYFVTQLDKEATDRFIFALPVAGFSGGDTSSWGTLYGQKEYTVTDNSYIPKKNSAWFRNLNSDPNFSFDGFNLDNCEEAILLKGANRKTAISASESGYLDMVSSITQLCNGIYLGSPLTQKRIDRRSYERASDIFFVEADEKVLERQEFSFLGPIFEKIRLASGNGTVGQNMTMKDLAEQANLRIAGSNEFYPVFIDPITATTFFTGEQIANLPFRKRVIENVYKFTGKTGRFLPFDKEAGERIKNVANACRKAFNKITVKDKLIFKYILVASDKSFNEGGEDAEVPEFSSIESISSNTELFAKRQLSPFSSGYSETQLFLQNMNELNPQFDGPFISTSINYYRSPTRDDFDMENGVNSISVTAGDNGISTSIKYSSKKFGKVDSSIMTDFLGEKSINFLKENRLDAWKRNLEGF